MTTQYKDAEDHAIAIANYLDGAAPRKAIDTEFTAACWIAYENPLSAIVVYEDEPQTQVAVSNNAGRFKDAN